MDDSTPPPKSLADQLQEIPAGESRVFDERVPAASVRSTLSRIKSRADVEGWDFRYTTRPDGSGLRVWRLT